VSKFPVDAPVRKVINALEQLGFEKIREGRIKKSTLRTILTQAGISRDNFLKTYENQ